MIWNQLLDVWHTCVLTNTDIPVNNIMYNYRTGLRKLANICPTETKIFAAEGYSVFFSRGGPWICYFPNCPFWNCFIITKQSKEIIYQISMSIIDCSSWSVRKSKIPSATIKFDLLMSVCIILRHRSRDFFNLPHTKHSDWLKISMNINEGVIPQSSADFAGSSSQIRK